MTVGGVMYDGTDGPDGVTVSEGDVINWFSDSSSTRDGFEICVGAACVATDTSTDDGSDGNLYCINGGVVGGVAGGCTCTSCNPGFGGANCAVCATGYSGDDCSVAADCVGTSTSTDDGTDGNFYCVNGGSVSGTTGTCTCTGCDAGFSGESCQSVTHQISTLDEVMALDGITAPGDTTIFAADTTYKCSDATCLAEGYIIVLQGLSGDSRCAEDGASCVLDGEGEKRKNERWKINGINQSIRAKQRRLCVTRTEP
jgi:hypothetical protein